MNEETNQQNTPAQPQPAAEPQLTQPQPQVINPGQQPPSQSPQPQAPQTPQVSQPTSPYGQQYANQQFQPQPPANPAPGYTAPATSYNSGHKQLPIKRIVAAVIAVTVLAGVIFGVTKLLGGGGVSIEDLEQASTKTSETRTKLTDLSISVSAIDRSYGTKAEIQNAVTESSRLLEEYQSEHEQLKSLKAMSHADVKESFVAYENKYKDYTEYLSGYISSMSSLTIAFGVCEDEARSIGLNTTVKGVQECKSELSKTGDLARDDINSTRQQMITKATSLESIIKSHNSLPSSEYEKRSELRDEYYEEYKNLRELFTNQVSANELKINEIRPQDELDKVGNALLDQITKYYREN